MIKIKSLIREAKIDYSKLDLYQYNKFNEKSLAKNKAAYLKAMNSKKVKFAGGVDDYIRSAIAHPVQMDKLASLLGMFIIINSQVRLRAVNSYTGNSSPTFDNLFKIWKVTGDIVIARMLNPVDVNKRVDQIGKK